MLISFLSSMPSDDEMQDFIDKILERDYAIFRSVALSQLDGDEDATDECIYMMLTIARKKKATVYRHPKPAAYLTNILKNCIKKQLYKRKHGPKFIDISTLAEILPAKSDDFEDDPVFPDSAVEEAKAEILSLLSEDEMRLYTMYCTDDIPVHEIAKKLDISYAAARTRIKRLKVKVRMLIDKYFS